jgi:hypothetical protein
MAPYNFDDRNIKWKKLTLPPVGELKHLLFSILSVDEESHIVLALIVARLLEPAAKLATARMLDPATASHSLGEMLGLGKVAAKEVYAALDWLGREQPFIEAQLARRHLEDGALLLYDLTSTYLEGRCCELAQYGYSRDHRGDRPQIVIGLMCAADGCPVAVGDPVLIMPVRNYLGQPLGDAEPTLHLGEQHDATIRRDPSAVKGGSDLFPLNGWKGERQQIIVGHGQRGAL